MTAPFQPLKLPAGLEEPGIYVGFVLDSDPGLSAPNKRELIFGYMTAGYPGVPDAPVTGLNITDVENTFGPKSMLAHRYAAAKAEVPIGFEAVLVPLLEPSAGTASAITFEITGEPVAGVLSSATAAAAADTMTVSLRGRSVQVGIRKDDTWEAIATAAKTLWDDLYTAPAAMTRAGAALTLTAPHKGAFDNGALTITFASGGTSGIAAKIGTLTVSGIAGAAGTVTVTMGKHTATVAVANTDAATVTGSALLAKINSTSNPVRIAQPGTATGVLTVFTRNGRPVRPLKISSAETGIAPQAVADSFGTAGAGLPSISAALANLAALDESYKAWSPFWSSTAELSSMVTSIEAQAAAPYQKGQMAVISVVGSFAELAAADLQSATTPKLNSSIRYPVLWAQCAPNADWELNVRLSAAIAGDDLVASASRNWDGYEFHGTEDAPLVPIHPADRPTVDERNAAIATYRTAPITVNSKGNMALVWGGNTYKPRGFKDAKLRNISAQLTLDYYTADLRSYLSSLFGADSPTGAKKIKQLSEPRTVNTVKKESVEAAVYRWIKRLDEADLFDGADDKRDAIKAAIIVSPTRIDVNVPFSPLADLNIMAVQGIVQ